MAHQARCIANAGHDVRIVAARGAQTDAHIPFVALPLADSRHPRVLAVKADLDVGRVTPAFDALRDELTGQLQTALSGVDALIAHNVCSLNKNLALTAALHHITNRKSQIANPKLILWHHDLAWTTPRYQDELHAGYPWDLLRTAWPGAAQVVISEMRRDELAGLMQISRDAISVIPNGLDVERFFKLEALTRQLIERIQLLLSDLILLLPVRITPRKNIELALHILAELRAHFAQPMLVVTGPLGPHNGNNASYFDMLRALRSELQLDSAAHFLAEQYDGFLPDDVIADFYRLSDALLFPSREEGFGLPMLEAAISRMPAFCADIPPLHALGNGDADFFSPDADPARVAALIAERMQHSTTHRSAARVRGQFTWEQIYRLQIEPLLRAQLELHNQ